jgi:hypothetical protein
LTVERFEAILYITVRQTREGFEMAYEMFTAEGNYMVERIATAGQRLAAEDGFDAAWAWTVRELTKLSTADGFEEAMDTAVREAVAADIELGVELAN